MDNTDCPLVIEIKTSPQSEVQMPIDEDDELDFFQPEYDDSYDEMTNSNTQKLISPYQEYAFTEEVLHEVANQSLDFFLPHEMWSYIERAFAYYWDEEVGFGNDVYFDSACQSIQKHLNSVGVLYPYDKLGIIIEILFDFIGQIPGVYLDESDIVIPKQRKENHDDSTY